MRTFLWYCIFVISLAGCKKEAQPPPDYTVSDIIDVYVENGPWSKAELEGAIVGDWKWKKSFCGGFGGITPNPDQYAGYSIRINSDKSLEVFDNGQLVHTCTWSLTFYATSNDYDPPQPFYLFSTDPKSNDEPFAYNLGGSLYLGGDVLVLSLLPVDGCDTFFERK